MVLFLCSVNRWRLVVIGVLFPLLVGATDPGDRITAYGASPSLLTTDTDGDGVSDSQDFCPNTPLGTAVNAYGCPKTVATCDYITSSITLSNTGGAGGGLVRFVLTDSVGIIQQVSATASFSGLSGSHTYMALSISHDGSATGLTVGQALSAVTAGCYDWSTALIIKVCAPIASSLPTDTDGDGVADTQDLCPNTPIGTAVNAYGCPKTVASCDYSSSSITLTSVGGIGGGTVRYVLADSIGTIQQVSTTASFSGLSGSHTYMALSISHDGSATGLTVGQSLSLVSASCYDWSTALVIRVCVAKIPPLPTDTDGDGVADTQDLCPNTPTGTAVNAYGCPKTAATCDYSSSSITLTSAGGVGGGTVRYVLADSVGIILQVSSTASFSGLSGSHTYMALAISHDGSAINLAAGQALGAVSASCYDWSTALVIKVCVPTASSCDYTIGATISLAASGGSTTTGTLTRYSLVNAAGTIVQVATSPIFSTVGLLAGSYSVYALVYTNDASITNLQTGSALATVRANCIAISTPLHLVLCSNCKPICVPILITTIRRR